MEVLLNILFEKSGFQLCSKKNDLHITINKQEAEAQGNQVTCQVYSPTPLLLPVGLLLLRSKTSHLF